jgi:hypothetical protein
MHAIVGVRPLKWLQCRGKINPKAYGRQVGVLNLVDIFRPISIEELKWYSLDSMSAFCCHYFAFLKKKYQIPESPQGMPGSMTAWVALRGREYQIMTIYRTQDIYHSGLLKL